MIFQYGPEQDIIQRILIGFEEIICLKKYQLTQIAKGRIIGFSRIVPRLYRFLCQGVDNVCGEVELALRVLHEQLTRTVTQQLMQTNPNLELFKKIRFTILTIGKMSFIRQIFYGMAPN